DDLRLVEGQAVEHRVDPEHAATVGSDEGVGCSALQRREMRHGSPAGARLFRPYDRAPVADLVADQGHLAVHEPCAYQPASLTGRNWVRRVVAQDLDVARIRPQMHHAVLTLAGGCLLLGHAVALP